MIKGFGFQLLTASQYFPNCTQPFLPQPAHYETPEFVPPKRMPQNRLFAGPTFSSTLSKYRRFYRRLETDSLLVRGSGALYQLLGLGEDGGQGSNENSAPQQWLEFCSPIVALFLHYTRTAFEPSACSARM